jgi:hypothetical protein
MAIFATHSIVAIEGAGLLGLIHVNGMAGQTPRGLWRVQVQDAAHAPAYVACQRSEGTRVFVLHHPRAVFILQNAGFFSRLNAAMATG